ncbi:hypothetical protein GYMLUDRAFT_38487 [Collybiopsis luxurians FD-317 M1]|nr:hypothetical protein GYMLUDRAFT_38487 [Collybiopsis luxurians FD-317 M1]
MFRQLLSVVLSAILFTSDQCAALQLRKALGPYDVGVITPELTDTSRLDPLAPTPQNRSVQLSVYYPTRDTSKPVSEYLPDLTATDLETGLGIPTGSLHNISTYNHINASILNGGENMPVILFSTGLGLPRLVYTTFVQDLASEGYIVIAIDHPYDASIVEMSDGRVLYETNPFNTTESILTTFNTRVADARFILDAFARNAPAIPGLKTICVNHVGFFGHSLGGATAATTEVLDARIAGGLNMDGTFVGTEIDQGMTKPFVLMLREGHNTTTDPTYAEVIPKLRGFRRELTVADALHLTFSDAPVVSKLLGIDFSSEVGTIPADRFDKIQHAYLTAYFDFVLKGQQSELLDGPSKQFPEVTVGH